MKKALVIEPHFDGLVMADKIKAAADLGFDGVEFWECAKPDARELGDTAARCGVEIVGCIAKGVLEGNLNRDYQLVEQTYIESLPYLRDMNCKRLLIFPGNLRAHYDAQKLLLIENLKRLSERAGKDGITVMIEPLNNHLVDHVGHYLDNAATAAEIIRCVNSKNVRMLYDIFHMQVMEGNIIQTIRDNISIIEHVHSAGTPGRHEHQLGELYYPNVIKSLDDLGYDGYFCLEYLPSYESERSIKDVLKFLGI